MANEVVDPKELWKIFNSVDENYGILSVEYITEQITDVPGFTVAPDVALGTPGSPWNFDDFGTVTVTNPNSPFSSLVVSEEDQPEPEPVIPQPTCRYFAISRNLAEDEGAETHPDWPYNQLLNFHACTNPKVNKMGSNKCQMVNQQASCVVYESSEPVVLKQSIVEMMNGSETTHRVKLSKTRYNYGTPEFKVTVVQSNDEGIFDDETATVMHVVDGKEHKAQSTSIAEALYDSTVTELGEAEIFDDNLKPKVVFPSYLKEKVA